jgi:fibronectin type 3 domain-containing protein/regulation of enolase protein 1 (concanavalin A-like superfamily)
MNLKSKFKNRVRGWWFTLAIMTATLAGGAFKAQAFVHPCIPATLEDLNNIKASLNQEPWKSGFAILTNASTSQLSWPPEGPFGTVTRNPNLNLNYWRDDMSAVWNLARMWYFTGNTNYAQKAHDILLAWANTQTNFGGQESGLDLGDYAHCYAGGADILRGTWPGWTTADTLAVSNLFMNVYWPACSAGTYVPGEYNKGLLNLEAGIAIAVFCDDTNKFNHIVDTFRSYPAAGLANLLATGEAGETGRDAGHSYGGLLGAAFISEVAWKQGVDLYSEDDNRLLAVGEYYCRNAFLPDNPFVPYGTVDYTYYVNPNTVGYTGNRAAFYLLQNAYKNRFHLPTPWIDRNLQQQALDSENWMYAKTADFTTATSLPAIVRPAVSPASSGLTLTTLGGQTSGRSASYANGVWTVSGLGSGVWTDTGGSDDCQFDYQVMTGDCAMVARVTSCTYSGDQNGKAGLMIRDNLVGTISQRAWVSITPTSTGTNLVESYQSGWTENWGGTGWAKRSQPLPPGLPYWVKIERLGNVITTYTSQDGTSWAPIVSSYYGNLPSTVYIGMFICSGNTTPNTATFEHVSFTGGSGGLVTTPAAPAAVFAEGSSKAITVRWLPSFGATAYDLFRSTTSGSGYVPIAKNLTTDKTSYVDTNVTAGTTYYYVVQARNSAGTSTNSPEFYASLITSPMVNLAFSGMANDSANYPANAENAFDRNPGSQWFYTGTNGWLQYDFGAGNAQVVKRYTVTEADTIAARDPKNWTFLGSQNGSSWTTLDSQTNQSFAYQYQQLTYNIANTTAYRYYRLNVTANNGDSTFLHVGELGLWGDSGRTIPDGRYLLVSHKSDKVMDGGASTNGTPLLQQPFNGGSSQQWDVAWQGNGQYRATAVNGTNVIDNGGTSSTGANLVIQPWSGNSSQLWTFLPDSDGFFHITSANSGLVADLNGGATTNGANIIQGAYNGSASQLWTPSIAVAPQPIPPTPTGLGATPASLSQINLSWTASPGAISYNVKRASVSGGPYTTVAVSVNTTNYLDAGLLSATTYYYVVSAENGSGESADSIEASATTLAAPPPAPTGLTAILGENQVTLSWTPSPAATSYNVKRATTGGGPYTNVATGVTSTNYVNTGLTNGVTFYYVVSASNAIGTGPDSAEVSVTPSTVVVHLKFDETSGTIAADSSGRAFNASLINGPTFAPGAFGNALVLTTNSPQYAILPAGVTSGLTNFTVSTWVKINSFATWQRIFDFGTGTGNYMFLTTQYTPTAPDNAKLRFGIRTTIAAEQSVSGTAIALTTNAWTHVAVVRSGNTVSLYVNGALAGSGTITLNPADLGVTTQNYLGKSQWNDPYLDSNLDDFRLYSEAMSAGEIAALANPAAGAPLQFTVVPGYGQATLTWLPNATTNYTVKRSTTSGGPYTPIIIGLTNLTYTDTGLTNGVTYYYVVSGANGLGSGPDSAEVSVTPSDLGLHLKFDETGGTIAADSSFRGENATLINGPTFTPGEISNALTLASSSSQYAALPTGVLDGLTNFTIMGWVKLNSRLAQGRMFDFGTGTAPGATTGAYMFLTPYNGSNMRFAITTNGFNNEQGINVTALNTGVWTHVAVTLSGSSAKLYVNGVLSGSNNSMTLNPSVLGTTTQNYLGKSQFGPDPYFNGSFDDFRIYNRALTAGEIALFQTQLGAPTGLAATPGNAQVQLTWDNKANATSYTLSRSGNSGGPFTAIAQPSGTNFTDTNVVNGGTYYYVVRAANLTGESPDSQPVSAQLVSLDPPNLSFTMSGGELQFSWPGDHTGWRLQMNSDLSTTNWQDIAGSDAANYISLPATNVNAYFRLVYP